MQRNRLIIALLGLSVVLFLVSCNGKPGAIVPDYSVYDLSPAGGEIIVSSPFRHRAADEFGLFVGEFNRTNEWGIKIRVISPDEQGAAPDLIITGAAEAAGLLRRGLSIEMSPLISHPKWGLEHGRSDFYSQARAQTDYWDFARKIDALPLLMDAEFLLVNEQILDDYGFKRFPSSWPVTDFLIWKIRRDGRYSGLGIDLNSDSLSSFIIARGGSILRPNGFSYSLNNPVVNNAISYIRKGVSKGSIVVNKGDFAVQNAFCFGRLAAALVPEDGIRYYDRMISMINPELNWTPAYLPTRRLGGGTAVNCSSVLAVTSADPGKQLSAWLFSRWLTSADVQMRLSAATGRFPANRRAAEALIESGAGDQPKQWVSALELFDDGFKEKLPVLGDYPDVARLFEASVGRLIGGGVIWLETWRLNREVKKLRNTEREGGDGRI